MVINKKRIKIIFACIFIGIFTFSFKIASNNVRSKEDRNLLQQNTIETTATPVSGKVIVLDAGHGLPDERSTK